MVASVVAARSLIGTGALAGPALLAGAGSRSAVARGMERDPGRTRPDQSTVDRADGGRIDRSSPGDRSGSSPWRSAWSCRWRSSRTYPVVRLLIEDRRLRLWTAVDVRPAAGPARRHEPGPARAQRGRGAAAAAGLAVRAIALRRVRAPEAWRGGWGAGVVLVVLVAYEPVMLGGRGLIAVAGAVALRRTPRKIGRIGIALGVPCSCWRPGGRASSPTGAGCSSGRTRRWAVHPPAPAGLGAADRPRPRRRATAAVGRRWSSSLRSGWSRSAACCGGRASRVVLAPGRRAARAGPRDRRPPGWWSPCRRPARRCGPRSARCCSSRSAALILAGAAGLDGLAGRSAHRASAGCSRRACCWRWPWRWSPWAPRPGGSSAARPDRSVGIGSNAIPPYVRNAMLSDDRRRVLAIDLSERRLASYAVSADEGQRLGEADRGFTFGGSEAADEQARDLVLRLVAGTADDDIVPQLRELGIGYVWVRDASEDDKARIDNTPGLGTASGTDDDTIWQVDEGVPGCALAGRRPTRRRSGSVRRRTVPARARRPSAAAGRGGRTPAGGRIGRSPLVPVGRLATGIRRPGTAWTWSTGSRARRLAVDRGGTGVAGRDRAGCAGGTAAGGARSDPVRTPGRKRPGRTAVSPDGRSGADGEGLEGKGLEGQGLDEGSLDGPGLDEGSPERQSPEGQKPEGQVVEGQGTRAQGTEGQLVDGGGLAGQGRDAAGHAAWGPAGRGVDGESDVVDDSTRTTSTRTTSTRTTPTRTTST